jgi:beta-ribofuranosylaminobenzene 5'-phosphate synthase
LKKPIEACKSAGVDQPSLMDSVTIRVPARLHLGFLDLNGEVGRRFGSIGLAISGYATQLTLARSARAHCEGVQSERGQEFLASMVQHLRVPDAHRLQVTEAIPSHAGLGSGTQMALAVAAALRRLHGLKLDIAGDAVRLGRGARSGIGIALFNKGGLVVDAGRGPTSTIPPVVSRIAFPPKWRLVLVLDSHQQGVHGVEERAAFATLPVFSPTDAALLCRLTLMKVLPALVERDIANFGAGISRMQTILGDYFAPAQGGRFADPNVAHVLNTLGKAGAHAIGQSSWGPTGFALAANNEQALQLAGLARSAARGQGLDVRICSARNRGAQISISKAAEKRISLVGGSQT